MVKIRWIVALAVILLIGVGAYVLLRPTEEKRIRRQLTHLADLAGKSGPENMLTAAGKARSIAGLMGDTVTITGAPLGMPGTYEGEELAAIILQGRMQFDALDPEIHDLEVVLRDPTNATAHFAAQLRGTARGERVNEVREIRCRLAKQEGDWIISRIEVVDVMRK